MVGADTSVPRHQDVAMCDQAFSKLLVVGIVRRTAIVDVVASVMVPAWSFCPLEDRLGKIGGSRGLGRQRIQRSFRSPSAGVSRMDGNVAASATGGVENIRIGTTRTRTISHPGRGVVSFRVFGRWRRHVFGEGAPTFLCRGASGMPRSRNDAATRRIPKMKFRRWRADPR